MGRKRSRKPGRNDMCACGSGRKRKRCCFQAGGGGARPAPPPRVEPQAMLSAGDRLRALLAPAGPLGHLRFDPVEVHRRWIEALMELRSEEIGDDGQVAPPWERAVYRCTARVLYPGWADRARVAILGVLGSAPLT